MNKIIIKYSVISALSCILVFPSHAQAPRDTQAEPKAEVKLVTPNKSFPVFIVKNLAKAKNFYQNNFGFNIAFENKWYLHLISNSGIQVAFMLPKQPTQPDIFHKSYAGNGVIFSFEVNDADAAYSFVKKQSLNIVLELRSEKWGQRHFSLKDPNGIYIDIVQAIKPSNEYQQGYETK